MNTISIPAHFDGERILLDEPVELERDAKLLITVLSNGKGGEEFEKRFTELADKWQKAHAFTSSDTDMVLDPSYQEIIGMGYPVVPLILRELQKEPDNWFWALRAISGENPVRHEDQGRIRQMAEAWVRWGRERGLVD